MNVFSLVGMEYGTWAAISQGLLSGKQGLIGSSMGLGLKWPQKQPYIIRLELV